MVVGCGYNSWVVGVSNITNYELIIICIIDRQQGAAIWRLDFTDAQGGKEARDRKAATIKVHMRVTKVSHTPFWGVNLPL